MFHIIPAKATGNTHQGNICGLFFIRHGLVERS